MPMPDWCDLELAPGRHCNEPVALVALSTAAPELWSDHDGGNACLAGFCSRDHAMAEARPSLAAAQRTRATVASMCDEPDVLDAWQRAVDAYPEPVPLDAARV
jgi:hypothetical protein